MNKGKALFLTAADVAAIMSISVSQSYKVIRNLNAELDRDGYLTIHGKVPAAYFAKKVYGGISTKEIR